MAHYHNPSFLKLVEDAKTRVEEFDVPELVRRIEAGERWVLVDIREDHEWQAGHIPGATHIGRGILERDAETRFPEKDTPLVLQCGGGFRSALSADNLQRMGYTRVVSLDGGIRAWVAAGYGVVKDGTPPAGGD
jgi:rhodanese-related sulfurtransferase